MTSATQAWRRELEAWAIPPELMAAVDASPYEWPVELFRRRAEADRSDPVEPVTRTLVRRLLGAGGSLLDVGAGAGRACLPLAAEGTRVVAVEKDPGMAAELRRAAAEAGIAIEVVEALWPEAVAAVPMVDVALSAHVVYDVPDLAPFLSALVARARRAVVIELTERHPWAGLGPYYLALHGLERPAGPTAANLAEVVEELTGAVPHLERWERSGQVWFDGWEELLALMGRRLAVPDARIPELRALLEPDVVESGGRLSVGGGPRRLVTVWWATGPPE